MQKLIKCFRQAPTWVRKYICIAGLGAVIIRNDHSEPNLQCTLIRDLVTFLSASLLRDNMYWSAVGEGSVVEKEERWIELMLKFDQKKITLATTGPCWANLSRQTREAAQQSGKIKTNAPRCSQPTKAITQRDGRNPLNLSQNYSRNKTLAMQASERSIQMRERCDETLIWACMI